MIFSPKKISEWFVITIDECVIHFPQHAIIIHFIITQEPKHMKNLRALKTSEDHAPNPQVPLAGQKYQCSNNVRVAKTHKQNLRPRERTEHVSSRKANAPRKVSAPQNKPKGGEG
jgi:hypothetical protein